MSGIHLKNRLFGNLWGIGIHVVLFAGASPQKAPQIPPTTGFSKDPKNRGWDKALYKKKINTIPVTIIRA
jgi:hypothetical protein